MDYIVHFNLSVSQKCSNAKLGVWYLFTFSHLHLKVPTRFSRHLKMQNKHKREHEDPKPGRLFLTTLISLLVSVQQQLFQ